MGNKTEDLQETCRNQQQGLNGDQETTERWTGEVANHQETSACRGKRGTPAYTLRSPTMHWHCRKGRP
jgi:hypothetical protein